MIATILGTGTSQGVPVIGCQCEVCRSLDYRDKRLRVSVHVAVNGKSIVIDSGPDFRQQMLRERIQTMDALLFTHEHKDHTAGMDDIRAFNFKQKKDMPVYARSTVVDQLKREFAYAFEEIRYPGTPHLDVRTIENKPFEVEGIEVIPVEVMHFRLPVFGFRIGGFSYITDANYIAPEELDKIRGSEVLIINALQRESHISHYTLDQALSVVADVAPARAYLTHMSHRMGTHAEVEKGLPPHVRLAYDGMKIEL